MSPALSTATPGTSSKTTVLVIGGGPAGSFASAVLAQEGIDVICCEASRFPRYHIGESLLAAVKAFLKMVDACEKIEGHGFHPKVPP
jgi:flavine halogenase